jgi:hypothetical protein
LRKADAENDEWTDMNVADSDIISGSSRRRRTIVVCGRRNVVCVYFS